MRTSVRRRKTTVIVGLAVLCCAGSLVVACGEPEIENQIAKLESVAASSSIGGSEDFWLSKQSIVDPTKWDKVALFFGMNDDEEFCYERAETLNKQYPRERWSCFSTMDK